MDTDWLQIEYLFAAKDQQLANKIPGAVSDFITWTASRSRCFFGKRLLRDWVFAGLLVSVLRVISAAAHYSPPIFIRIPVGKGLSGPRLDRKFSNFAGSYRPPMALRTFIRLEMMVTTRCHVATI
jgi:hypothetical protein